MSISLFETRTMLPMVDIDKRSSAFLRDRYFSNVENFPTAKIDIDIRTGKRRVASFVGTEVGGETVARDGYATNSYSAPEVSPDMITTAEDLLLRSPGENVYNAKSPQERAAEQIGRDLADLDDMITRREELMCSEALFTGEISVAGTGIPSGTKIKYWTQLSAGDQPITSLALNNRWGDTGIDPLVSLRAVRRKMIQRCGIAPTEIIMGTDALEAFLGCLKTLEMELDFTRVNMGKIDPQHLGNGVTYWGYMKDTALDIYSYDEWYLDGSGVEQPIVPAKKCLLGNTAVRTTMAYGAVSVARQDALEIYAAPRVPNSWVQPKNPAGRIVQLKSRPLPIIHQVQGFHVLVPIA